MPAKYATDLNKMVQSTSQTSIYTGVEAIDAIWKSLVANSLQSRDPDMTARHLFMQPRCSKDVGSDWYCHNKKLIIAGRSVVEWTIDYSNRLRAGIRHTLTQLLKQLEATNDFFAYRSTTHWNSKRLITTHPWICWSWAQLLPTREQGVCDTGMRYANHSPARWRSPCCCGRGIHPWDHEWRSDKLFAR
jgi:hypothetical protein